MSQSSNVEKRALDALHKRKRSVTLEILMAAYGDEIFRYCLGMLGVDADAQDVLQLTYIQAFEGLDQFGEDSSFRTWLYAIARNRCLDRLKMDRRRNARVVFSSSPPDSEYEGKPSDPREAAILQQCLEQLSQSARTAVLLRYQSDLSYPEVADIVQDKAGTIQARVARALPVLKACVEEHGLTL